jgi:hypothetical protein
MHTPARPVGSLSPSPSMSGTRHRERKHDEKTRRCCEQRKTPATSAQPSTVPSTYLSPANATISRSATHTRGPARGPARDCCCDCVSVPARKLSRRSRRGLGTGSRWLLQIANPCATSSHRGRHCWFPRFQRCARRFDRAHPGEQRYAALLSTSGQRLFEEHHDRSAVADETAGMCQSLPSGEVLASAGPSGLRSG